MHRRGKVVSPFAHGFCGQCRLQDLISNSDFNVCNDFLSLRSCYCHLKNFIHFGFFKAVALWEIFVISTTHHLLMDILPFSLILVSLFLLLCIEPFSLLHFFLCLLHSFGCCDFCVNHVSVLLSFLALKKAGVPLGSQPP